MNWIYRDHGVKLSANEICFAEKSKKIERFHNLIPWDEIEIKYAGLFPSDTGNVAKPLQGLCHTTGASQGGKCHI